MALLTLLALFLSFDFAVISAALLIHAFVASNDQVKHLRAAVPRGTVLNINRHGPAFSNNLRLLCRSSPFTDITTVGQVSTAAQALTIALVTASALAVFYRSKTRPKFFTILGSLLSFASLWLLSITIAFTVIFATKSARVSASIGGIQLSQSVISAQARALGVSPVYKDQSYRELRPSPGLQRIDHDPHFLSTSRRYPSLVHLVVHNCRSSRNVLGITHWVDPRAHKRQVDGERQREDAVDWITYSASLLFPPCFVLSHSDLPYSSECQSYMNDQDNSSV